MLHDLARLYSEDRLLAECAQRNMLVEPYERAHPVVLHARLGAELAREMFGMTDSAVLSAIRKHTLADADMTALDCILYLADALEPGRTFAQRASLASLAMHDLRAATRATLSSTIELLRERGLEPAPQTLAAAYTFRVRLDAEEQFSGRSA